MSDNPERLRAEAEAQISGFDSVRAVRPADELLHDLQVHQIELEMQNETLRQTQIALEESRDRYRDLYDFSPVAYLTLNENGLIGESNHAAARLLGVARKKLLNRRMAGYIAAVDADRWHQCFLDMLNGDHACSCELQVKRADAPSFFAHLECVNMASDQGSHSIRVTLTDITERKRAETLLRESEEKFHAIFAGTLDGIVLIDGTGLIVDCNPEFMRQTGMTLDRLKQTRLWELRPADKAELAKDVFLKVMKTGSGGAADFKYKQPDGKVIHVSVRGTTIHIGGKRFLQCISHDITERCRADEIVRVSALKHQLQFESSRDALMTAAPPSWKFTSANAATLELFGVASEAEFITLGPWDVSPERQPDGCLSSEKAREMLETAMCIGSHSFEWQHQRLDGQTFISDVLLTRMNLGDEPFMQATVRDISGRKRTETELREYQQLLRELAAHGSASREAELKHIAREVHDELGQLLTALRMDISLLRIQFGERDPILMEKIQDMLVLVDKTIRGARNVTTNLRPPALDMGIAPAIAWLSDEFTARTGIPCALSIINEPTGLDDARTVALFRIVQESLTNITRYAQASHVAITLGQTDEGIAVEVRDDGAGFDPSAVQAGRSFGLMGMKERALAVCGKVELSSAPAQGTRVSVRIPLFQTNPGRRMND